MPLFSPIVEEADSSLHVGVSQLVGLKFDFIHVEFDLGPGVIVDDHTDALVADPDLIVDLFYIEIVLLLPCWFDFPRNMLLHFSQEL